MPIDPEDFESYQQVKPMLRTVAAFALMLRFASSPKSLDDARIVRSGAYEVADLFLAQLEEDMKK